MTSYNNNNGIENEHCQMGDGGLYKFKYLYNKYYMVSVR